MNEMGKVVKILVVAVGFGEKQKAAKRGRGVRGRGKGLLKRDGEDDERDEGNRTLPPNFEEGVPPAGQIKKILSILWGK